MYLLVLNTIAASNDSLLQPIFESSLILQLFKYALIISGIFYLVFAIIVTRQINLMKSTLITSFSPVLTLLGYLHLFIAIMVVLIFLVIL